MGENLHGTFGKSDDDAVPGIWAAFHFYVAAMESDNLPGNGQSEAGAPVLERTGLFHSVKRFKYPIQFFGGDSRSGVETCYMDDIGGWLDYELYCPVFMIVFNRVIYNID